MPDELGARGAAVEQRAQLHSDGAEVAGFVAGKLGFDGFGENDGEVRGESIAGRGRAARGGPGGGGEEESEGRAHGFSLLGVKEELDAGAGE
jgi:hypothetical protein